MLRFCHAARYTRTSSPKSLRARYEYLAAGGFVRLLELFRRILDQLDVHASRPLDSRRVDARHAAHHLAPKSSEHSSGSAKMSLTYFFGFLRLPEISTVKGRKKL